MANGAPAALALRDVTLSFPPTSAAHESYVALRDVDLTAADGEFVALVGPTGCGKSTLLNAAAGLLAPSRGEVSVFGERLHELNRKAGYLFQADALMPWRNARDNVALGLELAGAGKVEAASRAQDWLRRVGLAAHGERYPHQLSGGMRKRVALAQTLILDPKILLMDEPFSALDIQTRQLMENELLQLWSQDQKCVLFVTHDLEEAIALADRVVVLSAGPGAHPVGEFAIDLPRPRDVAEVRLDTHFVELHAAIWQILKREVLAAHAAQ